MMLACRTARYNAASRQRHTGLPQMPGALRLHPAQAILVRGGSRSR
jgi:hypothetical protein